MKKSIVIGDADSLIALILDTDANYEQATNILTKLHRIEATVIYPSTAIAEAITALLRKHSNPDLAGYLSKQYKENVLRVEYVNENMMKLATELFNPRTSKQNTFFDAIVAACAKELTADAIFSFDGWYKKLGFTLATDLQ